MNWPCAMKPSGSLNPTPERVTLGGWFKKARITLKDLPEEPASSLYALMAVALNRPAHFGLSHPEYLLSGAETGRLDRLLAQLIQGEPLPYLSGHQEFYGIDILVTPQVLIPRPATETLVDAALDWLKAHPRAKTVLDIGTGSGCIAIALCQNAPNYRYFAVDISFAALQTARRNILKQALQDKIHLAQMDLASGLAGKFDCVCANLPYIPASRLPDLAVSNHEPRLALDGGASGLLLISRLFARCRERIAENGALFIEMDSSHAEGIKELSARHFPTAQVRIIEDLSNQPRIAALQMRG